MVEKSKIQTEDINLFEENRRLGGYNINVLEDWGFKLKKRFISKELKNMYQEEFGNKIITDTEFFEWWCSKNKLWKYTEQKKENLDPYDY